ERSMTGTTSFDDLRLDVRTWGAPDGVPIVLVHGLGLSVESWGSVPERLAERHRVVAYDLRGHGRSDRSPLDDYRLEAHRRDLDAVLGSTVPDGGTAVVVGHSLGGGILLAQAATGDRRIAAVVLAGSGGSGVTAPGLPAGYLPGPVRTAFRAAWLRTLRAAARGARSVAPLRPLADRMVRRIAFAPGEPADLVARVRDDVVATAPRALAGTTLASVSHDGVRYAAAVRVPTLVLHGTADPEVPEDEVHRLMDTLADAELVEVPGAGHMLPLVDPALVAEQIDRWATSARARSGGAEEASARPEDDEVMASGPQAASPTP
ncbi:alpha/beta hydrolase, partial [Blastococcus saxobsidens]